MGDNITKTRQTIQAEVPDYTTHSMLTVNARSQCWRFARSLYPSSTLNEAPYQGLCSYTLHLNNDTIIQFRPPQHSLDLAIAAAARDTFGPLAPHTQLLGLINNNITPTTTSSSSQNPDKPEILLLAYTHTLIPGTPLSLLQPSLTPSQMTHLIRSLAAHLFTTAYRAAHLPTSSSSSSPFLPKLKRRIGRTLHHRLAQLRLHLPARFQPTVQRVLASLDAIEALPWAMTHGDLIPANIMVVNVDDDDPAEEAEEEGGGEGLRLRLRLGGLVDWAEGEYLPFGVGLYGLECLLGRTTVAGRFEYYPCAEELRGVFWQELEAGVPELGPGDGGGLRARVEDARLLGVLLWHGFAFDDGALDRVVCEGRDDAELQKLDLFLLGVDHDGRPSAASIASALDDSKPPTYPYDPWASRLLNLDGRVGEACPVSGKL